MSDQLLHRIALTLVPQIGPVQARLLLQHFNPQEIFQARRHQLLQIEGIGHERAQAILRFRDFDRAEKEIRFLENQKIRALSIDEADYPKRLVHSYDPPIMLYYRGQADLNASRMLAVIGTRQPTDYGSTWTERILEELKDCSVTIVSGLAVGIDATAHRSALRNHLSTIGVLAHGLDRIYPYHHRKLAQDMERAGGLLTEFIHGTEPDRYHFPARNRLVAGMTDATLVIESGEKGGSRITASLANQYNRDVFALPGRVGDEKSKGCLQLIRQHQAEIFISTHDLIERLGWNDQPATRSKPVPSLFPELSEAEKRIVEKLSITNSRHQDQLGWELNLPSSHLNSCLLQLEMKGVVVSLPGKQYRLQR